MNGIIVDIRDWVKGVDRHMGLWTLNVYERRLIIAAILDLAFHDGIWNLLEDCVSERCVYEDELYSQVNSGIASSESLMTYVILCNVRKIQELQNELHAVVMAVKNRCPGLSRINYRISIDTGKLIISKR